MKKVRRLAILVLALVIAVAGTFAAWLVVDWRTPYKGSPGSVLVNVPKGTSAGQVLESLCVQGVVRSRLSLKLAYAFYGRPRSLKAGTYRFDQPLTPLQVIEKLNRGEVAYAKVTIPEGKRIDEVARILAENGLGREELLLDHARQGRLVRDLDPEAQSLEGYLFPETYLLDPGLSEEAVLKALLAGFKDWWHRRSPASGTALSVRELVTLASLVEKETAAPRERGEIAGVFTNRLRLHMPLQTDPTIIYAQIIEGDYRGRLTRDDWSYPSPYNTYVHTGLPPGPICSPGAASLEAALRPTPTSSLYFVSRNDGTHAFSKTLDEHNHAVSRFQRSGDRDRPQGSHR